ncbi:unnamed protein product [Durusdinium trenchii]
MKLRRSLQSIMQVQFRGVRSKTSSGLDEGGPLLRQGLALGEPVEMPVAWRKRFPEPMDAPGLKATSRLQELTKRRDLLKRQLAAMEAVEDPEGEELERILAMKDQLLLMERQLSDSHEWPLGCATT